MKKSIFLLILAFSIHDGFAQSYIPEEDKKLAESLKNDYKDESYVGLGSFVEFSFELAKDEKDTIPLKVTQTIREEIICLKNFTSYVNAIIYDDNSYIKDITLLDSKGKTSFVKPIISKKNYEENGIFYSDSKLYSYVFPFSGEGAKSGYELTKVYTDVKYLTSIYFHSYYPIQKKTISFKVPAWMEVELREMNMNGYSLVKNSTVDPKTKATTYTFTLNELDADKTESHAPGISHTLPHILILCKSYTRNEVKYPLFNNTADKYKWYSGLVKSVNNESSQLKPLVEKLITGKTKDQEKIEALFYWVQNNIRYIAFEDGIAGFRPASCQKVYNDKYGDCKGMANLLKQMLLIAGYDARLTWIGTRHIAYNNSIPSIAVDNHMICTLILNGQKYFLDPTETYIPFGEYAYRIQGKEVIIEDGDKYLLEKVPESGKDKNKIQEFASFTIQQESLTGKKSEKYDGESKLNILRSYSETKTDKKEEVLKDFIRGDDNSVTIANLKSSNLEERRGALNFDYDIILNYKVTDIGTEKYVSIDHDQEFKNMDFDSTRKKDYLFPYKYYLVKKYELVIPEGYTVKYLPENISIVHPEFTVKVHYKNEGGKIIYTKEISVDEAVIPKEKFKEWNLAIAELKKTYEDQIILSK
ncbi:MAG: DUF3858 domain-containing protein [Cytophagaceae bacterium]|nr:DUF3858 domain-containing protein [Cytophagaceae bacterium]